MAKSSLGTFIRMCAFVTLAVLFYIPSAVAQDSGQSLDGVDVLTRQMLAGLEEVKSQNAVLQNALEALSRDNEVLRGDIEDLRIQKKEPPPRSGERSWS
mmetsp:Transcript_13611/g.30024  ORF Transcript_13611/g.30024 Transcript_13611/m.30024 type:complete len:99 (+) Transcript_13611:182-478(+)